MLCYKDKTFCKSDCVNEKCFRFFSEDDRIGSEKWAKSFGMEYAPIAFSDYSNVCKCYMKPEEA